MSFFTVAYAEAAAAQGVPTNGLVQMALPLLFFVAVFYFMIIRPQKKREKQTKEMLASLKVGDEIVTIGGIIGNISAIKDDTITIEVGADKTKIKFERNAIRGLR